LALLADEIDEKCLVRHYAIAATCSVPSWEIFRRKRRDFHGYIKKLPFILVRPASHGEYIKVCR